MACQSGEMMPTEAPENLDERYETIDARLERRNHFYVRNQILQVVSV